MFEKVLVPTDFSEHAKKTIVCLTRIPGVREVVLQHVINATHYTKRGWTHETEIENAKIQMDEEKKVLERLGFSVKVKIDVITSGSVSAAILTAAECEKVSFIIMGSRGGGQIRGFLLGSVSADVLRQGKTYLLIIRHSLAKELNGAVFDRFCPGIFSRVLCPTDFSNAAQTAVSMLKRIEGIGEIHASM
jgi:nucleotide-binding universal stress UspA family protein